MKAQRHLPAATTLLLALAAPLATAQSTPAPAPATTPESAAAAKQAPLPNAEEVIEQNGKKFILVSTIKTPATNREFQNNVAIIRQQRNIAIELKRRIDQALTTPEKEALQQKLDEAVKKLDDDNKLMVKTYGFSLMRNYMLQIVKTHLYLPLDDEQYGKLPATERTPERITTQTVKDKDGKEQTIRLLHIATITGVADNDIFRQNVQLVQNQRQRILQLTEAIKQFKNEKDKKRFEEELAKSTETLQKNNEAMIKQYGFSLANNYTLEIETCHLYMAVSEEELKAAQAQKNNPPASPATAAPNTVDGLQLR